MLGEQLHIGAYQRQHRGALLDLISNSQWAHTHLDWYQPSQWLDQSRGQVFLAWQGEQLVGYMGLSLPIDGWCWIRLFGIRDGRMPGQITRELWEQAEAHCKQQDIAQVAILMITNWLPTYLSLQGFAYVDQVITLNYIGATLPAEKPTATTIRAAEAEDLPRINEIDQEAFQPPWRMSKSELWQAFRFSTIATVATIAGEVVGYQLSTRHEEVGHLARLAVDPAYQRRGIASILLRQLLQDLRTMRVETFSVNTQLSNPPSLYLYQEHGFFRNGYDMELWSKPLKQSRETANGDHLSRRRRQSQCLERQDSRHHRIRQSGAPPRQ